METIASKDGTAIAFARSGEGPPLVLVPWNDRATVESLQALFDSGDDDGVVAAFFREVVRAPEEELRMLRALPNWSARVAAAASPEPGWGSELG